MKRIQPTGLLLSITLMLVSAPALCGGLEFPDLGTVPAGRAGAFVAKADNPSAFIYNPAGLAKAEKRDLLLSVHLVNLRVNFARSGSGGYHLDAPDGQLVDSCPPGAVCIGDPALDFSDGAPGVPFEKVSMSKLGPLPTLVFNWGNLGNVKGLALSVGLMPPASFGMHEYSDTGAQRYAMVDSNHLILFPGVGLAYRFNRYFQVGGVFLWGIAHLNQSLMIRPLPSMASTSYNENTSGDARLEIEALDSFVPSGIFGVLSQPKDWLEIGASVKLPAMISAEGTMKYTAPSSDMSESYMEEGEDKVTLEQHFPVRLRVGARYIHDRFDIEADFVYENWKSLKGFDILPDALISDPINEFTIDKTEMPDTSVPKEFRDTYSARLGGDIRLWPEHVDLRLGAFYQSSAYPENNATFSVDFPYETQIGLSGGLSWYINQYVDVHAAYMHIFQPDVTVTEGVVQQQGLPLSTGEDIGNIINNGTYEVALDIFSIAVEGHF